VRDVIVIEKNEFGREASWAAGGILAPQVEADAADDFFYLARASRDMYPEFAKALLAGKLRSILNSIAPAPCMWRSLPKRRMNFESRFDWQRSEGLAVEWLTGDEARALEPALAQDVRCALRFADDWQVESRQVVAACLATNEKFGVELIDHCEVSRVQVTDGNVLGVEAANGFIGSPSVVIAAGAWSSILDPVASLRIEPVRGQMLCFKSQPGFARHVIYSSRGYLIPRRDGRLNRWNRPANALALTNK